MKLLAFFDDRKQNNSVRKRQTLELFSWVWVYSIKGVAKFLKQ